MTSRYVLTAIEDIKCVAGGVIHGVSRMASLSDERRYHITLVINELLVNAFQHAKPSPKAPVFVRAAMEGQSLIIGITDSGEGFDYGQPAEEDLKAPLSERGRGLKIVRALCSDIRYNEEGNSVEVKIAL